MHISASCVGSVLPDGRYKLVPQVEAEEEQPQEEVVAAAERPTSQLTDPSSTQAEGKPRCIIPLFSNVLAPKVYVSVH